MSDLTPRANRVEENIFINGGMRHAQLTTGPTAITGTYNAVDRWVTNFSGVTSPQTRRTGPVGSASPFVADFTNGLDGTINASTDAFFLLQRVEASRLRTILAGQTTKVSGSIAVAASVDASVTVEIRYPNVVDDWGSGTNVIYTKTETISGHTVVKFEDIDLPAVALDNGIDVVFTITDWSATGAQFVDLSDAMLNAGSRVAAFNERDEDTELELCRRYLEVIDDENRAMIGIGQCIGPATLYVAVTYKTKRDNPTVTFSAPADFTAAQAGGGGIGVNSITVSRNRKDSCQVNATVVGSVLTPGHATSLVATNLNTQIIINSEI